MKSKTFKQKWMATLTLGTMLISSLSPLQGVMAASVVPGHDITVTASEPVDNGLGGFYVTLDGTAGGPDNGEQVFVRVNWGDGTATDESFIAGNYTPLSFTEANIDAWLLGFSPYGSEYPLNVNGFDNGDWIGQHTYADDAACVVGGSCTVTAELYRCETPHGGIVMKCADGPEDDTELLANATTTIIFGEGPPPPPPPVDASITLEKVWVLNNPQSEAPSFSVLFEGTPALPEAGDEVTPLIRTFSRPASTYSLTENEIAGFETTIVCTRNQQEGNIYSNGGITVSSGDVVNCTITNDENEPAPEPATLTVEKVWQGESTEYAVYLDGEQQVLPSDDDTPNSETMELEAGSYTLSEPTIPGYSTYISCSYNQEESAFGNSSNGSYELDLEAGEDVICTVTNTELSEDVGTLIVRKVVVGSETPASAFTLHVEGNNPSTTTFQGDDNYGTYVILEAGEYSVTEDSAPGYTTTYSEDCEGVMEQPEVSMTVMSVGTLGSRSCTVTNTLIEGSETQGTLIVRKHVVNDNRGQADANDFLMVVTATNPSDDSFPGNEEGVVITVDPGTYSVDEDSSGAYAKSLGSDCSGTIAAGEVKTCTITNDDPGSPSTGGGSSGGGSNNNNNSGGGGGGGLSAAPGGQATGFDIPAGRVLGIEDVNTAEGACWADEPDARIVVRTLDEILAALGINRNLSSETLFDQTLVPRVTPLELAVEFRNMVKNWTAYGTSGGLRLGAGERAGVVDSYRAVYGHVPRTECEWRDALRIATGKLPSLNQERENQMLATFKTIYGRDADRTQPHDNAAINIMTYGIRPMVRSLANERAAIRIFRRIFGHNPANATEWDTMRAMANSGLALPQ